MNAIEAIDEIKPTRMEESALGEEREREAQQQELIARQTADQQALASQQARSTWDAGDQQRAMLVAGRPATPALALATTDSNSIAQSASMTPAPSSSKPFVSSPRREAAGPLETIVGTRFAAADRPIVQDTRTKRTEVRVVKHHHRQRRRDQYFGNLDLKHSKQMSWGAAARLSNGLGEELDRWEDPQIVAERVKQIESPTHDGSVIDDLGAASAGLAAIALLQDAGLLRSA